MTAALPSLRYVGALSPVSIIFPSSGRSFTVTTGQDLELLPSEVSDLTGRLDFTPTPTPDPAPTSEENSP